MQLGIHQLSQIFQTPQIALTLHLRAVFLNLLEIYLCKLISKFYSKSFNYLSKCGGRHINAY